MIKVSKAVSFRKAKIRPLHTAIQPIRYRKCNFCGLLLLCPKILTLRRCIQAHSIRFSLQFTQTRGPCVHPRTRMKLRGSALCDTDEMHERVAMLWENRERLRARVKNSGSYNTSKSLKRRRRYVCFSHVEKNHELAFIVRFRKTHYNTINSGFSSLVRKILVVSKWKQLPVVQCQKNTSRREHHSVRNINKMNPRHHCLLTSHCVSAWPK